MADRAVGVDVKVVIAQWPEDAPRGSVTRFCSDNAISRSWFYELRDRARREGPLSAVTPRARNTPSPLAIAPAIEELAVEIRKRLADDGWDHGAVTVRHKLLSLGVPAPSVSTLHRIFTRRGMVTPQPQKRPHSSWRRFEFALVHECWQLDAMEWVLFGGETCVVFQPLDDKSRYLLGSRAANAETTLAAQDTLDRAISRYQPPLILLTDNGLALNPSRRGMVGALVTHLHQRYGTKAITGRPYHPQTQGKDERVHATTKRWLRARPRAATLDELQAQLEQFDYEYNHHRPHQSLGMRTPAQALAAGPHADPPHPPEDTAPATPTRSAPHGIGRRLVTSHGKITVDYKHIALGTEHAGREVLTLRNGDTISVFEPDGTLIRSVTVNDATRYYGNGRPRGGNHRHDTEELSTLE